MPTRSVPDQVLSYKESPGIRGLVWNMSTFFEITSTVFYAPRSGHPEVRAKTAFLFHHGHTNCEHCPGDAGAVPNEPIEAGSGTSKCTPGCRSPFAYGTWWDLYNVSSFFHSLGYDAYILSMPLKGVNVGPGSNATCAE